MAVRYHAIQVAIVPFDRAWDSCCMWSTDSYLKPFSGYMQVFRVRDVRNLALTSRGHVIDLLKMQFHATRAISY